MNWEKIVDELYSVNDLVQGNKNSYKRNVINFGNMLLNEELFSKFSNDLYKKDISDYKEGMYGQKALKLINNKSQEEFHANYEKVRLIFLDIKDYRDLSQLFGFYDKVASEVFFEVYDKLKTSMEINAFFNTRIRALIKEEELNNEENYINLVPGKKNDKLGFYQLIIDGAPGTGKSYYVNKKIVGKSKNYERVTFYADYEYHDFVGSILPVMKEDVLVYDFVQGPFTKILNAAFSSPEEHHYLIIEELTRGNASRIFGDIFQLLDRDVSGWSEYPITNDNILSSLSQNVKETLNEKYGSKIGLPPNLSIICTVNSSDQNVYPLDTAFKRRFTYVVQSTKVTNLKQQEKLKFEIRFGAEPYQWYNLYTKLNEFFLREMQLKEDKQIGPYFIKQGEEQEMINKLVVYLWNDINKVHTMTGIKLFTNSILTMADLQQLVINNETLIEDIFSPEFLKYMKKYDERERSRVSVGY